MLAIHLESEYDPIKKNKKETWGRGRGSNRQFIEMFSLCC